MDPSTSISASSSSLTHFSEENPFLTISEDLAPSAPLPSSTVITLSFSELLSPPLQLQTNVAECGGQLWPAGMVLSEYLIRHHLDALVGKTILELGAGSGLVGLAIALALEQQKPAPPPPPTSTTACIKPTPRSPMTKTTIHLTDGMRALVPLLSANIALNNLSSPSSPSSSTPSHSPTASTVALHASLLPWGTTPLPPEHRNPDIILAADCVYFEPAFPLLEKTIDEAMPVGGATVLWFCYLKRRKRDAEMIKRLERLGLEITERDTGDLGRGFMRKEGYGRGAGEGRGKGGVVLYEIRRR